MEGGERTSIFPRTIPRKKNGRNNSKTRKRRYRERERERRGIIIKMREISKRSWIYVGTKMVSPGIKGSPYIRIVVTEVSTCRRIFICISISASPLSVLGKAKFSFIFRPRSSDLIAPTPSVIYILSRVFSFIRHVPRTRFSPAGNNTLDSPPVTPLYSTSVVARTHRFPSRR